uniref:Uncharacterized protein n=1 Tax=Daucus carota subsp. sativus TaxID=79200 RepID=A0A166FKI2_DAUCS
MDPEYVVLDASSDEDVGLDEKVVFDDSGEDDCDWIQELLKEVDRQTSTEDSDESDDVVLVSEVVVSPKSKLKNSDTGLKDLNDEEDDDDCVVLDGDPDKPEAVENNQLVDESDELQIVAETGQLSSTPNVMNNHMNMMPSQPMVSPPSSTANFFVSSVTEHQVPTQAYHYGNTFLRPPQSQLSLQPIVDNSYTNRMPSEPLIYGQLNAAPNEYQNINLNQDHSFLGSTEEDIDLSCINLTSESNQEPTPQHQDIGLVTEHEALPRTEQQDDLFGGSPNLDALNFQYDSWNLGSSDKPVHSPEPDISDSSFFFGL